VKDDLIDTVPRLTAVLTLRVATSITYSESVSAVT